MLHALFVGFAATIGVLIALDTWAAIAEWNAGREQRRQWRAFKRNNRLALHREAEARRRQWHQEAAARRAQKRQEWAAKLRRSWLEWVSLVGIASLPLLIRAIY